MAPLVSLPVSGPVKPGIERVRAMAAAALKQLSDGHGLAAAISTVCRGLEHYGSAYTETGEVVRRMSGEGANAALVVDDLGAGRLFPLGSGRRTAERFAADALGGELDPRTTSRPTRCAPQLTLEAQDRRVGGIA